MTVEVRLHGKTVGYARWNRNGRYATFQYAPSFLENGYEVSPLMMPLTSEVYSFRSLNRDMFHGLPGMLSDSIPDRFGNKLIDMWIDRNGIDALDFTPVDRLCYVGNRGMGALEYEPVMDRSDYGGHVDVDLLASLASDVLHDRMSLHTELNDRGITELMHIGTSAGGARAKAVIGLNESTMEVRSGQLDLPSEFEHWLIKFDTEDGYSNKGYCRIEHAYHEMAKRCGIEMMECRLLETKNGTHFMTKRFDRIRDGKVHVQTLCALAHFDFMNPGRYSYEDMMSIMRRMRMPYVDQEQLFRRMAFNIIMVNQDDHTKNFSFILDRNGKWRLSPAYDITYAFNPENFWIRQHQLSVNGKATGITREDLEGFAHDMNIKKADDIIDTIVQTSGEWRHYAKDANVPKESVENIEKHLMADM